MIIRFVIYIGFATIIGSLGYQIYKMDVNRRALQAEFSEFTSKFENINAENLKIADEIEYFSNEDNLEKEARAKFNYKKPGEKLIIVVPQESE